MLDDYLRRGVKTHENNSKRNFQRHFSNFYSCYSGCLAFYFNKYRSVFAPDVVFDKDMALKYLNKKEFFVS